MPALGQKRTSEGIELMSAIPPKADIAEFRCHVRYVPKADIGTGSNPNIVLGCPLAALVPRIQYAARFDQQ